MKRCTFLAMVGFLSATMGLGEWATAQETKADQLQVVEGKRNTGSLLGRRRVVLSTPKATDVEEKEVPKRSLAGKEIAYAESGTALQGWVVPWVEAEKPMPAVLVIPDWTGVGPFTKKRAEDLAGMGFVVLLADIYGKGVQPVGPEACAAEAGKYKSNRALFRARLLAGLEELKKQKNVDPTRIMAVGYCFGGMGVLELARAGAEVKGVVSFHGALDSPTPADGKNIKSKVLILHGMDDPFVPAEGIAAMTSEFNAAKVDWQMVSYSGAVHSFTNPGAGTDNSKGAAYNAVADVRSWNAMRTFFSELLVPAKP